MKVIFYLIWMERLPIPALALRPVCSMRWKKWADLNQI